MNAEDPMMTAGAPGDDGMLRFQHFEVLTKPDGTPFVLGKGAMGVTYKAFDRNLHSIVVIKVIQPSHTDDPTARRRFLKEAQAMARIRHPNVANIFHYGETPDGVFCALEFCEGPTLDEYLRQGRVLPAGDALMLCLQAADALQALEREDLVHRDIKPANIILTEDLRKTTQLKLIDFGLAKARGAEFDPDPDLTRSGFVGTPSFASPEQLLERTGLDIRSDIYSLGVTLWAMLTGAPLFRGSYMEVMFHHVNSEPAWDELPALPDSVRALLKRMLAKAPEERFSGATELWEALGDCLERERLAEPGAAPRLEPLRRQAEGGSIVGRSNYEILEEVGEVREGRLFRARDAVGGGVVALRFLNAEITGKPALVRKLRRQAGRLRQLVHENFVNVVDWEENGGDFQLVTEWVDGVPLLELLKTRDRVPLADAAPLLLQLARGLDHAIRHAVPTCETEVHQIRLEFGPGEAGESLVRAPLPEWGGFRVRINPLGITLNPDDYPGEAAGEAGRQQVRARLFLDFLSLTHRLLGGAGGSQTHPDGDYTTVPELQAEANDVLERYTTERTLPDEAPCQKVLEELLAAEGVDFKFEFKLVQGAPDSGSGDDLDGGTTDDTPEVSASGTLIVDPLETRDGARPVTATGHGAGSPSAAAASADREPAPSSGGGAFTAAAGGDGDGGSRIARQRLELERKRLALEAEAERLQHLEGLEEERALLADERRRLEEQRETLRQRDLERARAAAEERRRLEEARRSLQQREVEIDAKRQEGKQLAEEMRLRSQLEFQKLQEEREQLEQEWEQRRLETERLLREKEEQFLVREQRSLKAVREERERLQALSAELGAATAEAEAEAVPDNHVTGAAEAAAAARLEHQQIQQQRAEIAEQQRQLEAHAESLRIELEEDKRRLLDGNERRRLQEQQQQEESIRHRTAEMESLEQEHRRRLQQLLQEITEAEARLSAEREQVFTRERVSEAERRRASHDDEHQADELLRQQEQIEAQRGELERRIEELRAAQKRRLVTIACGVVVAVVAAAVGGYFVKARIIDPAALPYRQAWTALEQQRDGYREAGDWVGLLSWSVSTDDRFTNPLHFTDADSGEVDRSALKRFGEFYRDRRAEVVADAALAIDGLVGQWDQVLAGELDEERLLAGINAVGDWGVPAGRQLLQARLVMPAARQRGDHRAALMVGQGAIQADPEFAKALADELAATVEDAIGNLRAGRAPDRPAELLELIRGFPSPGWQAAPRLGLLAAEIEADMLRREAQPAAALGPLFDALAAEPAWEAELLPVIDRTAAAAGTGADEIRAVMHQLVEHAGRHAGLAETLVKRVAALADALSERPDTDPAAVLTELVAVAEGGPRWREALKEVADAVMEQLASESPGTEAIRGMQSVLIRVGDLWEQPLAFRLLAEAQPDQQERFDLYRRAAELDDIVAIGQVGRFHIGYGVEHQAPEHIEEGLRLLNVAAGHGDAHALFRLGEVYFAGLGVAPDPAAAIDFANRARDAGHPEAVLLLGKSRLRQAELAREPGLFEEAAAALTEAAGAGFAEAHYFHYISLWNEVINDAGAAVAALESGAARGDAACQHALGLWLAQGNPPVEQNLTRAREQMLAAARQGHPGALQWCRDHAARMAAEGGERDRQWVLEHEQLWR